MNVPFCSDKIWYMAKTLGKDRKQYTRWASSKEGQMVRGLIIKQQLGLCYICKGVLVHNTTELDHHLPLSAGGRNTLDNLYACCKVCNRSKGADVIVMEPKLDWWVQARLDHEHNG